MAAINSLLDSTDIDPLLEAIERTFPFINAVNLHPNSIRNQARRERVLRMSGGAINQLKIRTENVAKVNIIFNKITYKFVRGVSDWFREWNKLEKGVARSMGIVDGCTSVINLGRENNRNTIVSHGKLLY